ncbi:Mo-co oxidoreductase dimerization domain protein [compost metagenome]
MSVDGGRSWREAQLQEPVLDRALVRFRLPWRWDGGPASLESRAIDEAGNVQPTPDQLVAARGVASTYHYNAIQRWRVAADGSIANARA